MSSSMSSAILAVLIAIALIIVVSLLPKIDGNAKLVIYILIAVALVLYMVLRFPYILWRAFFKKKPAAEQTDLTIFINQQKIQKMELKVKTFVSGVLGLINRETGNVEPATFENETFTSDNESIFTAERTDDDTVKVIGVAEGDANLNVAADATYTDSNTHEVVTANKTVVVPVTISASTNPEETELVVTFGEPGQVEAKRQGEGRGGKRHRG